MLLSLPTNFLRNLLAKSFMPSSLLGKLICYGQCFCVYPSAYDSAYERRENVDYASLRDFTETDIRTSDGVVLKCYLIKQSQLPTSRGTVIMFHGNGYHTWCYLFCGKQLSGLGFDVLMVEYRGYGASEGKPSESGIRLDAQAALGFVLARDDFQNVPVILHGQSMGGAVAIDLASRNPTKIDAVILENTFLSIPAVVKEIPIIRYFTFLIHQRWNSAAKIHKIRRGTPILFLSGERDTVVPPSHMSSLRDKAFNREAGSKVEMRDVFKTFPGGTHSDTWMRAGYFPAIDDFLGDLKSI